MKPKTKEKRTYIVGSGWQLTPKEQAKADREAMIAAGRADARENADQRVKRRLLAEGFLQKALKWQSTPNTKAGDFYQSDAWLKTRYAALMMYDARCACCGASAADGVQIHVDHIKPRSKRPDLALSLSNLQLLCNYCNMAKSNIDDTDWRKKPNAAISNRNAEEYSDSNISAFLRSL